MFSVKPELGLELLRNGGIKELINVVFVFKKLNMLYYNLFVTVTKSSSTELTDFKLNNNYEIQPFV